MRSLLIDRLGFERIEATSEATQTWVVARKFGAGGSSKFNWSGIVERNGEEMVEFREVDDPSEELKAAHASRDYLSLEVRRLEGRLQALEAENGALALALHRAKQGRTT